MLQAEIQPCAEEVVQDSYTTKVQLKHDFQTGDKQANTQSIVNLKGTPVRKKNKQTWEILLRKTSLPGFGSRYYLQEAFSQIFLLI